MNSDRRRIILLVTSIVLMIGIIVLFLVFLPKSKKEELKENNSEPVLEQKKGIYIRNLTVYAPEMVNYNGTSRKNTVEYPKVNELITVSKSNETGIRMAKVKLNQPGDYVKYKFQIVNNGPKTVMNVDKIDGYACGTEEMCNAYVYYSLDCYYDKWQNRSFPHKSLLGKDETIYCESIIEYDSEKDHGPVELEDISCFLQWKEQ